MLQRYPELRRKVDMVISIAGFAHYEDFEFSRNRRRMYLLGTWIFQHKIPAVLFRNLALHPAVIKGVYSKTYNAKDKFAGLSDEETKAVAEFEVQLWRMNEVRTHMKTNNEFLQVNNCTVQVPLTVWHVSVPSDKYFNKHVVEQHLNIAYAKVESLTAQSDKHAPSVVADKKAAGVFFPRKLRAALNKA
jgi:hypothetical protein